MLKHKSNTIAEKVKSWLQEAPALPLSASGLPLDFREFFYRREESEQGSRLRRYAIVTVGLASVFFNWLPVGEYVSSAATLEESAMGLARFWVLTVVGLCWLGQYLKLEHSVLLVAPYAFFSPWVLYTLAYGTPFTALLAGCTGIFVAVGLAFVFRSHHRYRKVVELEQLTTEEIASLKRVIGDGASLHTKFGPVGGRPSRRHLLLPR